MWPDPLCPLLVNCLCFLAVWKKEPQSIWKTDLSHALFFFLLHAYLSCLYVPLVLVNTLYLTSVQWLTRLKFMESVFVTGCNCFAGFQNSESAKPDKKEKEKVIMLKSKKMLVKVGFYLYSQHFWGLWVQGQDGLHHCTCTALHRDILSQKKSKPNQTKPKTPQKKKPAKSSP